MENNANLRDKTSYEIVIGGEDQLLNDGCTPEGIADVSKTPIEKTYDNISICEDHDKNRNKVKG